MRVQVMEPGEPLSPGMPMEMEGSLAGFDSLEELIEPACEELVLDIDAVMEKKPEDVKGKRKMTENPPERYVWQSVTLSLAYTFIVRSSVLGE